MHVYLPSRRRQVLFRGAAAMVGIVAAATFGTGAVSAQSPAPAAAAEFPESVTIGHSFCYLNNEGMQIYNNSTNASATDLGWTIIPSTDSGSSPSQQLTDIESLISQGVNVLAIQPCDSGAIVPGVKSASEQGIAVLMTDIGAVEGLATTVVADELQSGDLACRGMVDALKAQHDGVAAGKVVQIQGEITSDAGQLRTKGFEDCIKETAPDVSIITVPTRLWDPTEGANGLQTTVGANPDIVGVYLQSDTQFWTGTKQVLETAGMLHKRGEDGHVVVTGVDGGTAMLQGIRDGYADADVAQPKTTYFNIGLPFIALQLQGKLQDIDPSAYAPLVIEKNAQGGITVKAPSALATPENADSSDFWGNSTCASDVSACPLP